MRAPWLRQVLEKQGILGLLQWSRRRSAAGCILALEQGRNYKWFKNNAAVISGDIQTSKLSQGSKVTTCSDNSGRKVNHTAFYLRQA